MSASTSGFNESAPRDGALHVRGVVTGYGAELRRRHPFLKHQNALGAGIMVLALLGMLGSAALYIGGFIAWWACLLLNAFFASLLHEIEHDLLHDLYFRGTRTAQHVMLTLCWLARPSTINPWVRRQHHLNHHKLSGTEGDIEERTLSNGTPWGMLRLLMVCDLVVSTVVMIGREDSMEKKLRLIRMGGKAYMPLTIVNWGLWYLFLGFHAINLLANAFDHAMAWSNATTDFMHIVDIVVVVLIGPNIFRTLCLHFITSNIHYYGDIEANDLAKQVQVLNPWWLWPFQAFCFNFGATHVIHHFVVKEPFYIRQLSAPVAYKAMREAGVRFNDYGTFLRANRWTRPSIS